MATWSSQAQWADIVAGVVMLIILVIETIYVLRQSRRRDEDENGDGGVRVPLKPAPRGPAPGVQLEEPRGEGSEGA